jgi:WD40 repeat protein
MSGEEFSSTDLHLACNDTLLVGQVAELTQVDPNDVDSANQLHQRKLQVSHLNLGPLTQFIRRCLQIWDFNTGQPLDMPSVELCTASCMMADNERIVLGRTDKFGNGTTIVIWDLVGNRALRRLKYDAAIGFADYISYLSLSTDNRYVVAGFQNSYDGKANYIVFDLTLDNYQEPKVLALDAQVDVTAVLSTHEMVTGTRSGELAIWSMRTGKPLRQLVTPPAGAQTLARGGLAAASAAHKREVTALAVSADTKFLVSASADGTLKVWDMETEKLMYTLTGHTDEVSAGFPSETTY